LLARSRGQRTDKNRCERLRRKALFKETSFEFRVKLMEDRASGEESVAVPSIDGGAEGCRSYFGR